MIQFTPAPTCEFILQDGSDSTHKLEVEIGNLGVSLTVDGALATIVSLAMLDEALRALSAKG